MILFTASGVLGLDTAKRWDVSGMLSMFGMFILEFLESRTSRPEVIVDFVHPNGAALLDLSLVTMPKGSTDLNGICRRIDKKKSKRSWFNIYIYMYIYRIEAGWTWLILCVFQPSSYWCQVFQLRFRYNNGGPCKVRWQVATPTRYCLF